MNQRHLEPYMITSAGRQWTRDTLSAAKRLADVIAEKTGNVAEVILTETGWVEYSTLDPGRRCPCCPVDAAIEAMNKEKR